MSLIIVAYYTIDTPYAKEVMNLRKSLEQFELPHDIRGIKSRGNWVWNCAMKPVFLIQMLRFHATHDLLYVDADAVFKQKPNLFEDYPYDMGIFMKDGKELVSNTIYLKNTKTTHRIVERWIEEQERCQDEWDQKVLQRILKEFEVSAKIGLLPPQYAKIYDTMAAVQNPVIEQYQASRRFKAAVSKVETTIDNVNIRTASDGSVYIVRSNPEVEKILDAKYLRCPGELRWVVSTFSQVDLARLKEVFYGKPCYIIGNGPSLDWLRASHFTIGAAPIIAINESIRQAESYDIPNPIYCMQQDIGLASSCKPMRGILLVAQQSEHFYKHLNDKIVFNYQSLGVHKPSITAVYAIALARMSGTTKINMMCFDACVNKQTEYADCIGYKSTKGGNPTRFLAHRKSLEHVAMQVPLEWVIPTDPSLVGYDTQLPLFDSQQEHHAPDHVES